VPTDVAMHEPDTWVVSLESQDDETCSWQKSSITTSRVVEVERWIGSGIRGTSSLSQDEEIVTVQMERVRQWNGRFDDNVNPLLWLRKLNKQVAAEGGKGLVLPDVQESWLVVLGEERCATEVPLV